MPPMYLPHQGCTGSRGQGGKIWATIALCYDSQPWLMPSQCTILLKNKSLFLQMLQGIRNFSVLEGIGEGQGISSLLTQSTDLSMWWVMAWQKHLLLAPILPLELWDFFLFLSSWNIDKTFSSAEKSRKWYEIGQTFSAFFFVIPQRELQEASQAELWCCWSEMDLGENWELDEANWLSRGGIHPFVGVKGGRTSLWILICSVMMLGAFTCPAALPCACGSPRDYMRLLPAWECLV